MEVISIGALNGMGLSAIRKNVDARVGIEEKLCLWSVEWDDVEQDVIDEIKHHNEFGSDDHGYHY